MLAYSSVAQAGYMLLGLVAVVDASATDVTALSMNGLNGLLIYLFGYLFTNIGAFMVVLAVENMTGGSDYVHFTNLVKRAPGLAFAMFIFLLSLVGIPLTAGLCRQVLCLWRHGSAPVLLPGGHGGHQRGHLRVLLYEPGAHHVLQPG